MNLSVIEIKNLFKQIIEKLECEEIKNVVFDDDTYRFIPTDKWNSFEEDAIEVGSLYDDIEALKLLASNEEIPCTYVDFDRLASVLRAISEIQNPATEV